MNKKRVTSFALAVIMAAAMAGCGSSSGATTSAETTAEASTKAQTTTESAASAESAAVTSSETSAETVAAGSETGSTSSKSGLNLVYKCDKTDGFVIGFSNGYWGNTWRAQMVEDFENRAEEYKEDGIISDYTVSNTNSDPTEQLNQINAMIDSHVDAILIDAVSPTTIKAAVEKAQAAGILVVIANDPAYYEGTICVCGDNYTWMKIQTEWLAGKLNGKGNIVSIQGVSGNSADTLRNQAVTDVLSQYPDINILAEAPGNWSETDAQSLMTTYLSSYDSIDGVLEQDVMAEGTIKAYENAGKDLPLMTGDYTKSFLNKWKSLDGLESIGVSYAPGNVVPALDVTVRILQGKTVNPDVLVANPMDETQQNAIMVAPPYVVTRDGDNSEDWAKNLPETTQLLSLDAALDLMSDAADTEALDGYPDQDVIDSYFE